ncbi:hypothetical protein BXZ70DRAFT_126116 [Cristinia sonorae]|uniref:Uncharacterized protein n=1 Tax=Cristinia sonorae TaxID=1940300 RepID=A0A8K0US05_9AGAR|nr:hypothetical protein BXZ70DRAFT_126116 [Cristinia sonorae]
MFIPLPIPMLRIPMLPMALIPRLFMPTFPATPIPCKEPTACMPFIPSIPAEFCTFIPLGTCPMAMASKFWFIPIPIPPPPITPCDNPPIPMLAICTSDIPILPPFMTAPLPTKTPDSSHVPAPWESQVGPKLPPKVFWFGKPSRGVGCCMGCCIGRCIVIFIGDPCKLAIFIGVACKPPPILDISVQLRIGFMTPLSKGAVFRARTEIGGPIITRPEAGALEPRLLLTLVGTGGLCGKIFERCCGVPD